jgi:hypothetical protein
MYLVKVLPDFEILKRYDLKNAREITNFKSEFSSIDIKLNFKNIFNDFEIKEETFPNKSVKIKKIITSMKDFIVYSSDIDCVNIYQSSGNDVLYKDLFYQDTPIRPISVLAFDDNVVQNVPKNIDSIYIIISNIQKVFTDYPQITFLLEITEINNKLN